MFGRLGLSCAYIGNARPSLAVRGRRDLGIEELNLLRCEVDQITKAPAVGDDPRVPLVVTDRLAQTPDVPADFLRRHPEGVGPEGANEFLCANRFARTRGECRQKLELLRRKFDPLAVHECGAGSHVEEQRALPPLGNRLHLCTHKPPPALLLLIPTALSLSGQTGAPQREEL